MELSKKRLKAVAPERRLRDESLAVITKYRQIISATLPNVWIPYSIARHKKELSKKQLKAVAPENRLRDESLARATQHRQSIPASLPTFVDASLSVLYRKLDAQDRSKASRDPSIILLGWSLLNNKLGNDTEISTEQITFLQVLSLTTYLCCSRFANITFIGNFWN